MDTIIEKLIYNSQSSNPKEFENALLDLRLIIERFTQNRYSEAELNSYLLLFNDKSLIDYRLTNENLNIIKYFLFFALFNFPEKAIFVAKCIKVLFDVTIRDAICTAMEFYMKTDDGATCELIFAITDTGKEDYFLNKRIVDLFKYISKYGVTYSKEAAEKEMDLMLKLGLFPESED